MKAVLMISIFISLVLTLLIMEPVAAKQSREEKQTQLDAKCEVARQKKLLPMREQFADQCVANEELPSREECQRFYADYGNRMGGRAPLFYDLPECVAAFDYRQSARSPD